jgi:hypothetical protein
MMRTRALAPWIVLLGTAGGCSESTPEVTAEVCQQAAEHLNQCLGISDSFAESTCDSSFAQQILAQSCDDLSSSQSKADGFLDSIKCFFGYREHCHYWNLEATFIDQGGNTVDSYAAVAPSKLDFATGEARPSLQRAWDGRLRWNDLSWDQALIGLAISDGVNTYYIICKDVTFTASGWVKRVEDNGTKSVHVNVIKSYNPPPASPYVNCSVSDAP